MKTTILFLSLVITSLAIEAQAPIPDSKSYVGSWKLSKGLIHGSPETDGMLTVNNPDGTFTMYTTVANKESGKSFLQSGTCEMTSDSTCTVKILKHANSPDMVGATILVKFRLIDNDTMLWRWKLGGNSWMPEVWERVK